jgi:DNA-binding beta-propeller fold protein YncE
MHQAGHKVVILCLWLLLAFTACVKDKPAPDVVSIPSSADSAVYIVCEGMYVSGNSTLTVYQPAKDSVYEDVFSAVNHQSLGDVFQSMLRIGNSFFLCINNSDRITVIRTNDWTLQGTIHIPKPRYILPVSDSTAFVSTLFSNKLYVINTTKLQLVDSLSMPFLNPEGMLWYTQPYVAVWDTANPYLYTVNPANLHITQSIPLPGRAPQELLQDRYKNIWVLAGNVDKGTPATLSRIDPVSGAVFKYFTFPTSVNPIKPVMNPTGDTLYFIEVNYFGKMQNNGIYRMSVNADALPSQPFIAAQPNQYFWGLGIHPVTGHIYVGDPKGFTQKGSVYIYHPSGTLLKKINTGVGPGHFYFNH